MDRRVTHLHVNRPLNCVLEVVQCICIIISDHATFVILAALVFPFYYYYFFLVKKRKPSFSNHIKVKYLVTVIVYQPTP